MTSSNSDRPVNEAVGRAIKFSVVIPTCNRPSDLSLCLERLAPGSQSLDPCEYEVIVSDDGSSSVQELLATRFPWAIWTDGPHRGPAANRNHGASLATGEWLVFTDDDCRPSPAWLAAYSQLASAQQDADVIEGRTSPCGERTRVDDECPSNERGGYLWSCNFAILKSVFSSMEGFDEAFPSAAMEDVDFRTRLAKANRLTIFVADAVVFHPWRREKGTGFAKAKARSIVYYLNKHPEFKRNFSRFSLAKNMVRYLLKSYMPALIKYRGRGAAAALKNRVALDYYVAAMLTD